jgi:hypothetical protein
MKKVTILGSLALLVLGAAIALGLFGGEKRALVTVDEFGNALVQQL